MSRPIGLLTFRNRTTGFADAVEAALVRRIEKRADGKATIHTRFAEQHDSDDAWEAVCAAYEALVRRELSPGAELAEPGPGGPCPS